MADGTDAVGISPKVTCRATKYDLVPGIVQATNSMSVLDVGCRDNRLQQRMLELAPHLVSVYYVGADLFQNENRGVQFVGDFTEGIPVDEGAFDLVTAFDVLEHTDDIQANLTELIRVARVAVAVTLPNIAHAFFRLEFARHGRIGGKYDLAYDYGPDRHRWVTVLPQADRFMETFAAKAGLRLSVFHLTGQGGWKLRALEKGLRAARLSPATWVWTMLYVLKVD